LLLFDGSFPRCYFYCCRIECTTLCSSEQRSDRCTSRVLKVLYEENFEDHAPLFKPVRPIGRIRIKTRTNTPMVYISTRTDSVAAAFVSIENHLTLSKCHTVPQWDSYTESRARSSAGTTSGIHSCVTRLADYARSLYSRRFAAEARRQHQGS
jgi:hypothetical protein